MAVLGQDIMSPIYTSEIKDDPVADEIIAQEVSISMPKKSHKWGRIRCRAVRQIHCVVFWER